MPIYIADNNTSSYSVQLVGRDSASQSAQLGIVGFASTQLNTLGAKWILSLPDRIPLIDSGPTTKATELPIQFVDDLRDGSASTKDWVVGIGSLPPVRGADFIDYRLISLQTTENSSVYTHTVNSVSIQGLVQVSLPEVTDTTSPWWPFSNTLPDDFNSTSVFTASTSKLQIQTGWLTGTHSIANAGYTPQTTFMSQYLSLAGVPAWQAYSQMGSASEKALFPTTNPAPTIPGTLPGSIQRVLSDGTILGLVDGRWAYIGSNGSVVDPSLWRPTMETGNLTFLYEYYSGDEARLMFSYAMILSSLDNSYTLVLRNYSIATTSFVAMMP